MLIIITMILGIVIGIYLNGKYSTYYFKIKEKFDSSKFTEGLFDIFNPVLWAKDITQLFNIRKIVIYTLIVGIVFGYGYYKGLLHRPVKIDIGHGKEAIIKLNGDSLHIYKDGSVYVEDEKGNKIKQIQVKDIPELKKKLKPYGFDIKPIGVLGTSIGENGSGQFEGGAGISWFRYFKMRADSFITNKGIYPFGVSYKITDNSGVGIGSGMGYKGDKRIIFYYRWEF